MIVAFLYSYHGLEVVVVMVRLGLHVHTCIHLTPGQFFFLSNMCVCGGGGSIRSILVIFICLSPFGFIL